MQLRFHITDERKRKVTLRGQIALQDMDKGKEPDARGIRDLLAPFLQDEDGVFYEVDEAREVIEDLDVDQLVEAGKALAASLGESDLPKPSKRRSRRR